jgi:cytochrome P450
MNPWSDDVKTCPHAHYDAWRAVAPVRWSAEVRAWRVLGYDEASAVLDHPDLFASSNSIFGPDALAVDAFPALIAADGVRHARMRALLAHALDAPQLERRRRAMLGPIVEAQVSTLPEPFDSHAALADPLAWRALFAFVGIAPERCYAVMSDAMAVLRGFGAPVSPDDGAPSAYFGALTRLREALALEIAERRELPRDDLLTRMLHAEVDGGALTDDELIATLIVVIAKGGVATASLIASAVDAMAADPRAFQRLRDDRSLLWNLIEETLRTEAPVQGLYRRATADVDIGGAPIASGDAVCILYGAANRDPAYVDDADAFNLDGARRDHLALGLGAHVCPGAGFARTLTEMAIDALLDRFVRLDPDGPPETSPAPGPLFRAGRRSNLRGRRPLDAETPRNVTEGPLPVSTPSASLR